MIDFEKKKKNFIELRMSCDSICLLRHVGRKNVAKMDIPISKPSEFTADLKSLGIEQHITKLDRLNI